ncbi:MAG TPA: hypothetical protein VK780_09655 [Thermoanaerobaculia bacterium]|nr:hypothetical protein [Thermoanaerobaculia bacterium]
MMFRVAPVAAAVLSAIALDVSLAVAEPDLPTRTRVTIRGTGNSVAIERTPASGRRVFQESRLPPGPLGEAIRLKREGTDDAGVIAYLRFHAADLSPVIEAGEVRLLRQAGAGKSVTNFLATVSAVDLGPMGGGRESAVSGEAPAVPEIGMPGYDMSYGDGYAGGFGYAAAPRVGYRHFPHVRPMNFRFPPPPPRIRPMFATRGAVGRRFPDSP